MYDYEKTLDGNFRELQETNRRIKQDLLEISENLRKLALLWVDEKDKCTICGNLLTEEEKEHLEDTCFSCHETEMNDIYETEQHPDARS